MTFALMKPRRPGPILAFTDLHVFVVVHSCHIALFLICYILTIFAASPSSIPSESVKQPVIITFLYSYKLIIPAQFRVKQRRVRQMTRTNFQNDLDEQISTTLFLVAL